MKKIAKIIARYWCPLIAIVALIFVQAFCDLQLPEKTSNIINIGIQQGGIENSYPTAIRASEMQKLMMFMEEDDIQYVTDNYTRSGEIFNLTATEPNVEKLTNTFSTPIMAVYGMEKMKESAGATGETPTDATTEMPTLASIKEEISKIDGNFVSQMSISYIKNEYETIGIDVQQMQTNYIIKAASVMLLYAFFAMASNILSIFLSAKVAAAIGRDIRKGTFTTVMQFSTNEFDKFSSASLITRSTNDIQQVQMFFIMLLRVILYAPIIGIGALIKVINQGTSMTWVIGIAILAVLSLIIALLAIALPKFQIVQKLVDKLNLVAREILTGLPVIRAFSRENYEKKRFDDANKDLTKVNLFVNRVMTIMMPTMMFIMNGVSVLILWIGSSKIDMGFMQVGDLMAFISYSMQIIMAFLMISMMSIMLPRAIISLKRLGEIFNTTSSVKEPTSPVTFNGTTKGKIEFKNVSFRYNNAEEDVLHNLNFTSKRGETTAIIGSTGSGKSTLINLIPRFYDVTEGEILVDDVNINDVTLHDLRDKVGLVPQSATLFSGTIETNIKYSNNDMSDAEMEKAARISQSTPFIESKRHKYKDEITQAATNLSGGQKQRISIARAIAKNPEILIFDDSFSALDFKTDLALRKALTEVTTNCTVLIVAQRVSTVMNANRIIVLDEGNMVGIGTHDELMKTNEVYRQIALSQLSQSELDGKVGA